MPTKIDQLSYAIKSKNKEEIKSLAHNIKGACANLSALKVTHYSAQLETLARSEGDVEESYVTETYVTLFEHLKESYNELIAEFSLYIDNSSAQKATAVGLSYDDAIEFLSHLSTRLAENDYIESDELAPLIESEFSSEINILLDELQQMIMLFELDSAHQQAEKIMLKLQDITAGES